MNDYKLRVVIDAVADKFGDVIANVESKLEGLKDKSGTFGEKLGAMSSKLDTAAKKMAPVSAGAAAIGGALIATAKKTAQHTDQIDKMSQKLGFSRKAYQEWDYVLSQAGTDVNSMTTGMKTLTNTVDDCAKSGSTAGTAFEELGISWSDLEGKSREDIFALTIDRLQSCEDETKRAALANDLFGKSGQNLAPLLNEGSEATQMLKDRANELGMVLSDDVIDAGVDMTDALDTMKRALATVGIAIGSAVMPMITQFAYFVAGNVPKITKKVKAFADAFQALPSPIKNAVPAVLALVAAAAPALKIASLITGKLSTMLTLAKSGAGILGKVLSLPPTALLVVGVIALIIAAFVHLYKTNEEFRTKMQDTWAQIVAAVTPALESLKAAWVSLQPAIQAIITAVSSLLETVGPVIAQIVALVITAIAKILPPIASVLAFIIEIVSQVIQVVAQVIQKIIDRINTTVEVIKTIIAIVKGIFIVLGNAIVAVWEKIKNTASSIWDNIKQKIQTVVSAIKSIANSLPEPVKAVFTKIATHVTNVFNKIKSAWQGLKDFASGVANGIGNAFSKMVQKVKSIINKFIGAANAGISVVNALPGVSISKIPYLKHGTKNWAGGFAMMNEGGRGEMTYLPNGAQVIPHDVSMKYAKEAAKYNNNDDARFYSAMNGLANAMLAGMQMNNAGGGEYHFEIDLGGTRVAEKIYKLNKQGELILKGA